MTRWLFLTVASFAATQAVVPSSSPEFPRFGVGAQVGVDLLCVAGLGNVRAGTQVLLVNPSDPQYWFEGRVRPSPPETCARLDKYLFKPPYTALDAVGPKPQLGDMFVALVGPATPGVADSAVEVQVPSSTEPLRFRTCTSIEGLHLTVWLGKPLLGKRLWHEYVYLGFDVEPTCTKDDYAP
jgi:hypothetical protein